jgi:hypothetical protein
MKNFNFKSLIPILAAIIIFITITFGYFSPLVKGKVISQSDMTLSQGASKEINDFREKNHSEPLWTNSMFGGMPAYQVAIRYPSNLMTYVRDTLMLGFPTPANMVFLFMLGFYVLLLVLKVDKWLAIVGSIGFGFSAGYIIIIAAGHTTQAFAIAYMAPVFAGVILVCRGKYLIGGALTALAFTLEILCNHFQIAYYLILFLSVYVGFEWIARIRQKQYMDILKSFAIFALAGVLALGCNIANLWSTYEYGKFTIRGPSELTTEKGNKTSGLDKDYATQWSMGKSETMTLMVPGVKGMSSSIRIGESKKALDNVDSQMKDSIANMPQYWGDQPFTDAPYSGAIIIFLFILGLFIVDGRIKWALLTATILSILLSWGKNFMPLTDLFLDHFPGYNKFRAVSMMLMVAEFAIPILAILAIDKLMKQPEFFKQKIKLAFVKKEITVQNAFLVSFGLTGGLALLYYLVPTVFFDFSGLQDKQYFDSISEKNGADIAQKVIDNAEIARVALFKSSAIRSFFFITLAAGAIWLYLKSTINKGVLIAVLAILVLFDMTLIDKNFLNEKNFTSKQESKTPFPATTADNSILEDKDPDYRVLNIAVQTFQEASTSYYHKSIGGYSAAKLRRYQEMIDAHIQNEIENIISTLRSNPSDSSMRATFARQNVLNMLNTRYIIYNPEAPAYKNRYAMGNAWFVNDVKMVKNADEELKTIGEINPRTTLVVDERDKGELDGFAPKTDASASIKLTDYSANDLKYESNATTEQVAVFSEIYFKDGWNAYVDGELKPYFSGDWVLRAMRVPAGKHNIEFKFEPTKYYTGEKISLASCLVLFGFIGISLFVSLRKKED